MISIPKSFPVSSEEVDLHGGSLPGSIFLNASGDQWTDACCPLCSQSLSQVAFQQRVKMFAEMKSQTSEILIQNAFV